MTAPPLVVDVVPPPDLPAVRSRSRASSGLIVALVLLVVTSLGMISAAPRANALIPVVAKVGAAAVSVLGPAAVEWVLGDGKKDEGGDDEESKKKRGKWGQKLKGLPGLAAGLLGGLWGATTGVEMLTDGDGVEMPAELTEELADDPLGTNYRGVFAEFTPDPATLNLVPTTVSNLPALGLHVRGSCKKLAEASGGTEWCPSNSEARVTDMGTAYYNCFDPATGGWRVTSSALVINGLTEGGCSTGGVYPKILPLESVVLRQPSSAKARGLDKAYRIVNPDFDWSITGNGEASGTSTVTAEVECSEAGTGNVQTVTKTVPSDGGVIPLAPCPTGWAPKKIGWTETPRGGGAPEYLGGIQPATPAAYPDCAPGECVRVITVDGQPCDALRPECFDWMNTQPPTRVKCEFGPHDMPISECADLAHIHKSTHGVTWAPGPDGVPQWMPAAPNGKPDPTRVGTWTPENEPNRDYRPVVNGPLIQIGGNPGPDPTPTPNPSNPPTTVQVPPPVFNPPGGPKDPENPTKNCIAGMASWNPVDWVYTPVKCALTWAFIPNNNTGGGLFGQFRQKFTDSGIGPWLAIPPLLFGDLPEGSGCMGPPLNMPASLGGKTYYPLNACSDPMAKYANMSRSLITIVVVFYGMFSVVNSLTTALTGYRMFERESAQMDKKL